MSCLPEQPHAHSQSSQAIRRTTRYTAIVRIRRGGVILHRESRTFAHRSAALSWARHREVALEDPSALTRVQQGVPTVAELIRWYIDNFESVSNGSGASRRICDSWSATRSASATPSP